MRLKDHPGFPMWAVGTHVLGASSVAFPEPLAMRPNRSLAARVPIRLLFRMPDP